MSEHATTDPRAENRRDLRIILAILVVLVVAVLAVVFGGWHMLGIIGIGATLLVFVVLIAFAAGS